MLNTKSIILLFSALFVLLALLSIDRLICENEALGHGIIMLLKSYKDWINDDLLYDVCYTILRVAAGFSIASALGIVIGLYTGRFVPLLDGLVYLLNYLRAITPVALAPFFLVVFGISETSKILLITWGAFFPIWVNAHLSNKDLSEDLKASAKLQGLSKFNLFQHFYLPATISGAYPGARIAIGLSFILVYISETLGAEYGIGYRLKVAYDTLQVERMMAALLLLGLLGLISDKVFVYFATKFAPWLKYERNANRS